MQSETGFPSSHQLKSYVTSKSRLKLAARAVLSADAGLLVHVLILHLELTVFVITTSEGSNRARTGRERSVSKRGSGQRALRMQCQHKLNDELVKTFQKYFIILS